MRKEFAHELSHLAGKVGEQILLVIGVNSEGRFNSCSGAAYDAELLDGSLGTFIVGSLVLLESEAAVL